MSKSARAYNTNLAREFYVLSVLHRLGLDAHLTLGNKKSVDVVVSRPNRGFVTIDVKGVRGKYEWPAGNIRVPANRKHFIVFVSYEGGISEPESRPRAWVVPYREVGKFMRSYGGGRVNVSYALRGDQGARYENAWHLIKKSL